MAYALSRHAGDSCFQKHGERNRHETFARFWREGLGEEYARVHSNVVLPNVEALTKSAIIAVAEAVDCVHESDSRWFAGPHGLLLQNVRVLPEPVYCSGALGFFNLPEEIAALIASQLFV